MRSPPSRRRSAAALLLVSVHAALSAGPASGQQPARDRPVAVSAAVAVEDGRTRLTLALSKAVEATSFHLEAPDRIVVELPDVNCQLPPEAGRRRVGLVDAFRCGLFALGRTRLVIELAAPAIVSRLSVGDGAVEGVKELVIEIAKTDRATFRRAARALDAGPETTGSIATGLRPDARPLVAIDAGHGGIDPGATAATGAFEKDIVLAFSHALRDRLAASGRVRVMMTRDADVFVPLDDRVRHARAAGADLFVSIHGDSIGSPTIRGATLYTGAERATDAESAKFAERENGADAAAGIVPAEARAGVSDILTELTMRETRGLSRRLAGILYGDLAPVMRFSAQPHREAGFRVLRAADMTSVLVELGYLSNAADADLLLSDDWRGRCTAAMAGAIERFFGPRLAGRAAVSP